MVGGIWRHTNVTAMTTNNISGAGMTLSEIAAPQNCATPSGTDGEGSVYSVPCKLFPSIPSYQKWNRYFQKTFVNDWGIQQVVYTFRNRKSGECLDVIGHDGTGDLKTYPCHGKPD